MEDRLYKAGLCCSKLMAIMKSMVEKEKIDGLMLCLSFGIERFFRRIKYKYGIC